MVTHYSYRDTCRFIRSCLPRLVVKKLAVYKLQQSWLDRAAYWHAKLICYGAFPSAEYMNRRSPSLQAAHEAFEGSKAAAGSAWHSDSAHKATNKAKVSGCRPVSLLTSRHNHQLSSYRSLSRGTHQPIGCIMSFAFTL